MPVALLICAAGLLLVWRGQPWREEDGIRQMAWGILAVILLHSLLEYPLWYGPFQVAAGLCLWLLLWVPRTGITTQVYMVYSPLAQYSKGFVALLLIAISGFAAWNYHLAGQIYLAPDARAAAYRQGTLEKTRHVWLFKDQVRFADLTINELNAANALSMLRPGAGHAAFFAGGPVIELVLDSALLSGRSDEAAFFAKRMQAAFPTDYTRWQLEHPEAHTLR